MGVQGHYIRLTGIKFLPVFLSLFLFSCLFCIKANAQGSERIVDFNSQVTVNQDSSMNVVETITVECTGNLIKRGIYRDFPTRYKDSFGNSYTVGFDVESVLRDSKADQYRVENMSNGKRVYIGREDYILPPGRYTYTITYRTDGQLGFFKEHDELYWNVTGNGWSFSIDKATASVILPKGVPSGAILVEGYTGPQGSKARNLKSSVSSSGTAEFATTKPLNPKEGLTIVVTWPKGYVTEPSASEKVSKYYSDNSDLMIGITGFLILLLYYLTAWWIVGRDPKKGTIIPTYLPPYDMSPAVMRFIREMGYDQKAFAASIINMAVKGYLWVNEVQGKYTLVKGIKDESVLGNDERAIAGMLGLNRYEQLELNNRNHSIIRPAMNALRDYLKAAWQSSYFKSNNGFFWGGVGITVAAILAISLFSKDGNLFMLMWSSMWGLGIGALLTSAVMAWRRASRSMDRGAGILAVVLTVMAVPFVLIFLIISLLSGLSNFVMFLVVIAMISGNIIFFKLLKAHTQEGRRVVDRIEGFRMYLSVAEKDRMNLMNPPEKTPELFERYLPYALALGVEQQWGEQFAQVLSAVSQDGTYYYPSWYRGGMWNCYNIGAFTGFFGNSFSGIISAAGSPPGSSSGSHGGGFSGGGGGGGGGSGW